MKQSGSPDDTLKSVDTKGELLHEPPLSCVGRRDGKKLYTIIRHNPEHLNILRESSMKHH